MGRKKGFHSVRKGKTLEEIYGVEKAILVRQNMSEKAKLRKFLPGYIDNLRERTKNQKHLPWSKERREHFHKTMLGHPVSIETREKLSIPRKGKKYEEIYGVKRASIIKNKLKVVHKNIQSLENHPMWKGGISFLPYSIGFNKNCREGIRERDRHICQLCHKSEKDNHQNLIPHHIDYDKMNTDDHNLISLCRSCNAKVNVNREKWTLFFQKIMEGKSLCLTQ